MPEHLISIDQARENLLECAIYLAENINSREARAAAIGEVVSQVIKQENVDLAAELADSLDEPFARNKLLTQVISKCVQMNDNEYAFQLVQAIDDFGRQSRALEVIALQTAEKGDFEKALGIAENLDHSSDAYAGIAVHQAEKGLETEATNTLEKVDFSSSKVRALISIAVNYILKKQPENAVSYLEKAEIEAGNIEFTEEKINSLLEVSVNYIECNRNDKAIQLLAKTQEIIEGIDGIHKDNYLVNVAVGFLRADSMEFADRTLDLVHDKVQISNCLLSFSQEFLKENDEEEALDTLEESYAILKSQEEKEIRNSKERYRLFGSIAAQFAHLKKQERAIEIAHENDDNQQKNLALSKIAQISIQQGKDEFARQALSGIQEESQKLTALVAMSDVKNNLDKKDDALDLLNEAAQLIDTVEQYIVRTEVENEIVKRFYSYGEAEKSREFASKSLQTIEIIKGEGNRSVALAQLSEIYKALNFELSDQDKSILDTMVRSSEFTI